MLPIKQARRGVSFEDSRTRAGHATEPAPTPRPGTMDRAHRRPAHWRWRWLLALGGWACLDAGARAEDWPPAPPLQMVADDSPGPLPPSIEARALAPGRWQCVFRCQSDGPAAKVTLAGTFNEWRPDALPLTGPDADGFWTGGLELRAGVYEYKFVADGQRWFADPQNRQGANDHHNGQNSVLRLGRIANLDFSPAQVGDGKIETLALQHDPNSPLHVQQLPGRKLLVRLRTLAHDLAHVDVTVRGGQTAAMSPVDEGAVFALWEGVVPLAVARDGSTAPAATDYTFVLVDGGLRGSGPEPYGVPVSKELFRTPDWAKHAIWYQIFPDRFRNGDPTNDREPVRPWTSEWFTPSPWEGQDGQTFYRHFVFDRQYGGDIAGIEEKLPYLKELGVNALYLNPIFQSESNHKYNATSYVHVDEHFGVKGDYAAAAAQEDPNDPKTWVWTASDLRFRAFLKKAHELGFRVIIDGVFNHVGTLHPAFQDVIKSGRASLYADWFDITSWKPLQYEGWAGHAALPVFKKGELGFACPAVKEHVFNVTRRWMDPDGDGDPRDGIDGWRLDVPNEVPAPFWVEWRKLVKKINPDAYIVGEIWDRSEQWLDGRHFDAVMNYPFARAAAAWIFHKKLKIKASECDRRLRELRLAYPLEATLVLQNLLDSHDSDRVVSQALNPDRKFDEGNRVQDNGPKYNTAKPSPAEYARARLAALLQMTYVSAPMIFYGDEVGMWGADDPTCRKPMLWEDLQPYENPEENFVMKDQLAYYQQIIALRIAHPALRTGSFQTLLTDDKMDLWAFLRADDNEQLLVVLNASDKKWHATIRLPDEAPNKWQGVFHSDGLFTATEHKLVVELPPVTGVVLHAATPK